MTPEEEEAAKKQEEEEAAPTFSEEELAAAREEAFVTLAGRQEVITGIEQQVSATLEVPVRQSAELANSNLKQTT